MSEEVKLYTEENKNQLMLEYSKLDYQYLTKEQVAEFIVGEVLRAYSIGFDYGREVEKYRLYDKIILKNKEKNNEDTITEE